MAFPTVSDADTQSGTISPASNSWTVTYPTNIDAGDLILLFASFGTALARTPSATGFTVLLDDGPLNVLGLVAAGTETGNFTLSLAGGFGGAAVGEWRTLRLPAADWYGGTLSAGTTSNASDGVSAPTNASANSTTPDPPSSSPAWGSADTLWLTYLARVATDTVSGYPSGYGNTAAQVTNAVLAIARLENATGTEDPGTYTTSGSGGAADVVATIAIRPAAAATNAPAGNAAGTGASNAPKAALTSAAGNAAGTGASNAPSSALTVPAGNAAGTGASLAPTPALGVTAGQAAGTGSAGAPSTALTASAGAGTGAGSAETPTTALAANAQAATGAGSAQSPSPAITASAPPATGTGTAYDPSTMLAAVAQAALGTGSSLDAAIALGVNPQAAAGTGSALNPFATLQTIAGIGLGTGTGLSPTVHVQALAGLASGIGSALDPTVTAVVYGSAGPPARLAPVKVTVAGDVVIPGPLIKAHGLVTDDDLAILLLS